MKNLPAFLSEELAYREHEGKNTFVTSLKDIDAVTFACYIAEMKELGWQFRENHRFGANVFYTFTDGADAAYLSFYPGTGEMRLVTEPDSAYLGYLDESGERKLPVKVTQIDLEDFGLSYVVRMDDGRFIIFDGGWPFPPDADKLMSVLKEQSPDEKPRIAAWIMTHPHIDHYRCFLVFWPVYKDEVVIEKFIYNFPDTDAETVEKVLPLSHDDEIENLEKFDAMVAETGAAVYRAHSGQVYTFGRVRMEVLSCPDDTFAPPVRDTNPFSLINKMTIEGQTILWCADGYFAPAKMAARYGDYLKADILQVPHHGFNGGESEEYRLIDPRVCMASVHERDMFTRMNLVKPDNITLIHDLHVEEFFTGSTGNITLTLPYEPRPGSRKQLLEYIAEKQKRVGAHSFFFTDLTADNCTFTVINTARRPVDVYVDLYFEDPKLYVDSIRFSAPGFTFTRVALTDPEKIDDNALYFNRNALKKMGIPEGAVFAAHFRSEQPVVIEGPKPAAYIH
ncbi:MAG: MBL fold metallo-hydrolase [Oscillospiraceae bacterium]|nr:MBL fold metallo-hydrolase [Oscillospiraceae bacterium]